MKGLDGKDGIDGKNGVDGIDGKNGDTPFIGENGNWWLGETDIGVKAAGVAGEKGDIDLLFVSTTAHRKGIGKAARCAVQKQKH